jgi:hypothetical protein
MHCFLCLGYYNIKNLLDEIVMKILWIWNHESGKVPNTECHLGNRIHAICCLNVWVQFFVNVFMFKLHIWKQNLKKIKVELGLGT